ncbi:MAG: hypothetical protein ACI4PQ_01150 [Butyricicoccaceae bacterium]
MIASNREELKDLIFDLMNGLFCREEYRLEKYDYVEDAFEEGKECARLYDSVMEYTDRICDRLDSVDDVDLMCLKDSLYRMERYLCMQMFDYGVLFAGMEQYREVIAARGEIDHEKMIRRIQQRRIQK